MQVLKSKKSKTVVATVAILALGGGAAFAWWTSSGDGVGAGSTGTSTNFVVASSAAVGDPLTPGGVQSQLVAFTVTNPANAGHQTLNGVTVAVAGPAGAVWAPTGCSADDYLVSITTPTTFGNNMAPGDVISGTATLTMVDRPADQNACKTLAVPLYFAAS